MYQIMCLPALPEEQITGYFNKVHLDRVLSPDIVQFRSACLRTEIFLRELTLSSTLSSNPKSSHSVDPQFFHKLLFYLN